MMPSHSLLAIFEAKDYARALLLAEEARDLSEASKKLPGVETSRATLDANVAVCELLSGKNNPKTSKKTKDLNDNDVRVEVATALGMIAKEDDKDAKEKKESAPAKEREWKFYLGKESPDKKFVYANSSDEPARVYAVEKSTIDSLYFENPNHLRSKRLFDFTDATAKTIEIKQGGAELELTKGDDNLWRFVKPSLGFADFEGPPAP